MFRGLISPLQGNARRGDMVQITQKIAAVQVVVVAGEEGTEEGAAHEEDIEEVRPRNFKGGIRSLFNPCVNAMRRRPYWLSCMEGSYSEVWEATDQKQGKTAWNWVEMPKIGWK